MHLTSSPVDWYAARAAGITAYVLLSAVVMLGLALASHEPGRRWRRWPMFAVEDVHRVGGLLVGAFIAIHVATIAVDAFLPFSLGQLVVPLTARYRPVWTGLGIAAAELLIALAITNHYRRRLPHRWWRAAHYANFAVWVAATLHGLGAGTDRNAPWMLAIYGAAAGSVAALTLWRVGVRRRIGALRPAHLAVAAVAAAAVAVGLGLGPMATGASVWNAGRFDDRLSGRIVDQQGATRAIVSMTGVGSGVQNVLVRADLLVAPASTEAATLQMEFLPSGLVCQGPVERVEQFGFQGSCTADGRRWNVDAGWRLRSQNALTGAIHVRP
jgi:methionine sulfoxide reductase heme-binding subunit